MNREIRDEWVKRLRSGDYAQGKSYLRNLPDQYCCLGVLCEIATDQGAIKREEINGCYMYDEYTSGLSPKARGWAGMLDDTHGLGDYRNPDDNPKTLAWDNDHSGCDFNAIADIIEREF